MINIIKILLLLIADIILIGCHHADSKNETAQIEPQLPPQKTEAAKSIHMPFFEKPSQTKICQKRRCVFQEEPISVLTLNGTFQEGEQKTAFIQDTVEHITRTVRIGDVLGDKHWVVKDVTLSSIALEKKGEEYFLKL